LQKLIDLGYSWSAAYHKKIDGYYAKASIYIGMNKNNLTYYMHKIIVNNQDGRDFVVHHKNKDTLDNRKFNLEIVPYIINTQLRDGANKNSSTGVRNVNWIEKTNEYWVQIMKEGERYKWTFPSNMFEEACVFAKNKRIELFGEE
jgi:hypothetical protein